MKITKTLVIQEVRAGSSSNQPIRLSAGNSQFETDHVSHFGIARHKGVHLGLVGRKLSISLEMWELHKDESSDFINLRGLGQNDLLIGEIKRVEEVVSLLATAPPMKNVSVTRTVTLHTPQPGRGGALPCPYYELNLKLSEEEYELFKALPPNTAAKLKFKILSD